MQDFKILNIRNLVLNSSKTKNWINIQNIYKISNDGKKYIMCYSVGLNTRGYTERKWLCKFDSSRNHCICFIYHNGPHHYQLVNILVSKNLLLFTFYEME